jgi:flagellar assembly factor FliW
MSAALPFPSPPRGTHDDTEAGVGRTIHFPRGLLGFPDCQRYQLEAADVPGFYWLRSEEHAPLAFVLVDPFQVIEGYHVDLPNTEAATLGVEQPSDVAVLAIATVPREAGEMWTANLQGPLAINFKAGVGVQFVRAEAPGVRTPFRPAISGSA